MSAEMARFSKTISLILLGGTFMSFATLYCVIPSGFRNSFCSISPGCTGFNLVICGS